MDEIPAITAEAVIKDGSLQDITEWVADLADPVSIATQEAIEGVIQHVWILGHRDGMQAAAYMTTLSEET